MDGGRSFGDVFQQAQLRSIAVFEKHFLPAVMIEVGQSERAAVLQEIETDGARDIGKCSIAIVRVEDISLVAAPGGVGANQFVDGVPALFVIGRRLGRVRRIGDNLAPEEAVQVFIVRSARIGPETIPLAM